MTPIQLARFINQIELPTEMTELRACQVMLTMHIQDMEERYKREGHNCGFTKRGLRAYINSWPTNDELKCEAPSA